MPSFELDPAECRPRRLWKHTARVWAGPGIIAACLALLPFGRTVEIAVLVMALLGVGILLRGARGWVRMPGARLFGVLFACVWIPVALSWLDAESTARTARVAVNHFRFLLAGVFIIAVLAQPAAERRLSVTLAWILAFWVCDGVVQSLLTYDLFGYERVAGRVNALFGERNPKYGSTLAILAPLLWEHARRRWQPWLFWLSVAATWYAVLVGGNRSGWLSIAFVSVGFLLWRGYQGRRLSWRAASVALLVAGLLVGLTYATSVPFHDRVDATLRIASGDTAPNPVSHRTWIWRGAWNMFKAHPVNGVGARGFRDAFEAHAAPGDPYIRGPEAQLPTHSHQLLLEVAAETGATGLLGLAVLLTALGVAFRRASGPQRERAFPYLLVVSTALFPLNTHLAFFSAFASQLHWWAIALVCGALTCPDPDNPDNPEGPGDLSGTPRSESSFPRTPNPDYS